MGGNRLKFTDALDIALNDAIWFSDASQRWGLGTGGIMGFWESRPTGRLPRYNPASGATIVALDSIDFANGVALSDSRALPPARGRCQYMVVGIDTLGRVRYHVQDPSGRFHATTGAAVAGDTLYVGRLLRNVLARLPLPRPK